MFLSEWFDHLTPQRLLIRRQVVKPSHNVVKEGKGHRGVKHHKDEPGSRAAVEPPNTLRLQNLEKAVNLPIILVRPIPLRNRLNAVDPRVAEDREPSSDATREEHVDGLGEWVLKPLHTLSVDVESDCLVGALAENGGGHPSVNGLDAFLPDHEGSPADEAVVLVGFGYRVVDHFGLDGLHHGCE